MSSILFTCPTLAVTLARRFGFNIQPINFALMYSLIAFSQYISTSYWITIYSTLFIAHEILNITKNVNILSEEERVDSSYQWFDQYLEKKADADLTEGYFKDDVWTVSSDTALNQKYDKFYELLGLRPGMKVLDLGCGYGDWMKYLRNNGVDSVGLTLSQNHNASCLNSELITRIGDARNIPSDLHGKFDAVTMLGSVEHMAKVSWSTEDTNSVYETLFEQTRLALKPKTKSGKVLITVINTPKNFSINTISYTEMAYSYLIERHFSGRYPHMGQIANAAPKTFKQVFESDQTEDYRYISIINSNHFGNFVVKFDTIRKLAYVPFMFLSDPYALHKWLYYATCAWMWQFGGVSTVPERGQSAPFHLKWEVYERF